MMSNYKEIEKIIKNLGFSLATSNNSNNSKRTSKSYLSSFNREYEIASYLRTKRSWFLK